MNEAQIDLSHFQWLPHLLGLDLTSNAFTIIRNISFIGLRLLEELSLSNNLVARIDNLSFTGMSQLNQLDLNFNKLKFIKRGMFSGLKNLENLRLKDELEDFDFTVFDDIPNIVEFELDGNTNSFSFRIQGC